MKARTNSYWEKRATERMAGYEKGSEQTISIVSKAYDKAVKDIENEIDKIFSKFAKDGKLTPDDAKALLNRRESAKVLDAIRGNIKGIKDPDIKRKLLNRLNAPAYKARLTRLQVLKEQVYIQSKIIADAEIQASSLGYIDTINEAYYRNLFDIQKGLGLGFNVAAMPARTIETILKNPWSGEHFSSRVWKNTDVLAEKITEVVTAGFQSGAGIRKMTLELENMSNLGKMAAARLVRTETTYMANAAEMESYKEAEIEEYIYIATLDNRTSEVCQEHDKQRYKVKDAVPGKNMPPLHPWCRSTTRAYFSDIDLQSIGRRARNPETGKTYLVPGDMDYGQWYEKHVVNQYGKDQADVMKNKILNKVSDQKLYVKYKAIYGQEIPQSFEKFLELKYNKVKEWNDLKDRKQERLNSLDYNPSLKGLFGDLETRLWYISHDKNIVNLLDSDKDIKDRAMEAHSLRNKYRSEARLMMQNRKKAEELDIIKPNLTFEELVQDKIDKKGLTKDQAYYDIINTAGKTNKEVNSKFNIEG
ncbi:MAG: minor capsid protein [Dehalobacter sp.]|nr:minor capsid protein [Dehalobacter sp.]